MLMSLRIMYYYFQVIQEAFCRFVTAQEDRQLFDAFTELGTDSEMSDVSFAFEAQADVALRD